MSEDGCPLCGADLRAEEIPEKWRHLYREGSTHFTRAILVEIRGVFDGGLFYHCPDCRGDYHRWPEGHPLRGKAQEHMNR